MGHAVDIDVENMVIRRITSLTVLLNQYWCRYIRPHLWQHHAELMCRLLGQHVCGPGEQKRHKRGQQGKQAVQLQTLC